jgi:DNA-binding NtrC family response regulator
MYSKSILIVNADLATAQLDVSNWERAGVAVQISKTFDDGLMELQRSVFDMLIVDARLDLEASIEFCRTAQYKNPSIKLGLIVSEAIAAPSDIAVDALIIRCSDNAVKEREKRIGNTDT